MTLTNPLKYKVIFQRAKQQHLGWFSQSTVANIKIMKHFSFLNYVLESYSESSVDLIDILKTSTYILTNTLLEKLEV